MVDFKLFVLVALHNEEDDEQRWVLDVVLGFVSDWIEWREVVVVGVGVTDEKKDSGSFIESTFGEDEDEEGGVDELDFEDNNDPEEDALTTG